MRGKQAKEKTKFLLNEKALPTDEQEVRAKAATKLQSKKRANAAKAEVSSKRAASKKKVGFTAAKYTPPSAHQQADALRDFASPLRNNATLSRIVPSKRAPPSGI